MDYERQRLATTERARRQELTLLGLSNAEIGDVVARQTLVTHLVVRVDRWADVAAARPRFLGDSAVQPVAYAAQAAPDGRDFTVESLHVSPGRTVQRGADLCHLAYHRQLYIQGQAFEADLPALERLQRSGGTLAAQFGHAHGGTHYYDDVREGLRILYLDNHVDATTQTFQFYAPLENEPAHDEVRGENAVFRTWKFKPGQRTHLLVPEETWEGQIVVPREAVVVDGLETIAFRRIEHGHSHAGSHSHSQGNSHADDAPDEYEFEPVHVQLLHRDGQFAVLAKSDELHLDDDYALNNAQQLLLALKLHTGGGGGGHDHAH